MSLIVNWYNLSMILTIDVLGERKLVITDGTFQYLIPISDIVHWKGTYISLQAHRGNKNPNENEFNHPCLNYNPLLNNS